MEQRTRNRGRGRRVRTGCLTCKLRHIKCDETRPSCHKCTSTGRQCDGYDSLPDKRTRTWRNAVASTGLEVAIAEEESRSTRSSPSAVIIDTCQVDLTHQERGFLDFFRKVTSPQCAGYFTRSFWRYLVNQASESEPAVCHAVIGMSALHWNRIMQIQKGSQDVVISLPLQQCGKALQHLQDNLSANLSSRTRMESVLVSCLILIAFSFSYGDAQAASCHLQAAYQLLHDWQKVGMYNSPIGPTVLQTLNQPHLEWLPLTDPRHGLEVSYFWPVMLAGSYDLITSVKTPEEAGGIMVILGWLVLQIRPKDIGGRKSPASHIQSAAQATLDRILQWKIQALQSTGEEYEDEVWLDIQKTVAIFDIWAEMMLVKMLTDDKIEKGESRYDSCLPHFKRIIELVKGLLKLGSLAWTRAVIITPIFFCAFKCRDWYVRREALALMSGWEREKGIWSVSGPALVLARLIEIESKNLTPLDIIPEGARIDATRVDFFPQEAMVRFWFRRALPAGLWRSCDARWVWDSELISY